MNLTRIILASGSPRRRKLLEQINLPFTVQPGDIEEVIPAGQTPPQAAMQLAEQKAGTVCGDHANALVIGADTIVVAGAHILGKPSDEDEAFSMLRRLSGRTHLVYTGVALLRTDENHKIADHVLFHAKTQVTFGNLDDREIRDYIETGSPMDKAGAYGIQDDWGSVFVKEIRGDYYNVVGFPLHLFYRTMKDFAPELLPTPLNTHV